MTFDYVGTDLNIYLSLVVILIGVVIIATAVYAHKQLEKSLVIYSNRVQGIIEARQKLEIELAELNELIEAYEKSNPKIIFICDGEACDHCKDYCTHTADIGHAANFTKVDDGLYVEGGLDD